MKVLAVLLALVACRPATTPEALGLLEGCACVCTDAGPGLSEDAAVDATPDAPDDALPDAPIDAAVDAPPDAPPPISMTEPWVRTVITAGVPGGSPRGADGVALDPAGCLVTGWEEANVVTRACPLGDSWVTEVVATGVSAIEDARAADLDGDGVIDVAFCGADRCWITFRGTPNVTVALPGSMGHGNALQLDIADLTGDGLLDIVYGTRTLPGQLAVIAQLENPGALARTGPAWSDHVISRAGWTMSVEVHGARVVVSDRASYKDEDGVTRWDLYGARWLEQVTPGVWVNHPISPPAGACPPANPLCNTKTPGDEMFLHVDGNDVWDCQSSKAAEYSRIVKHSTTDWVSWTHTVLPPAANVGHCQHAITADVDGDGLRDVVVSTWKANAPPVPAADAGKSLLYWLRAPTWERGEIAIEGGKADNLLWLDDGPVTTEQLDPPGGLGVIRYDRPGAAP